MALTHTITMDPPALQAFRLQEKGGPLNFDNSFTIGAELQPTLMNNRKMFQRLYWVDSMLVLQRRAEDGSFEMIFTRTLDDSQDEPQIILKSLHRDLLANREVEATSWFTKTGPSPNPPPQPDLSLLSSGAAPAASAVEADCIGMDPAAAVEDYDNDEDEDEVAVAKMRTISVVQKTYLSRALSTAGDAQQASQGHPDNMLAFLRSAATASFVDFSGQWKQSDSPSKGVMKWMNRRARLRYSIKMTTESLHCIEMDQNTVIEDARLDIGNKDYVAVKNKRKNLIKARCFWEGSVLVVHKIYTKPNYEIFIKRELDADGQRMRQVTIRKDVTSGTQTEFMVMFHMIINKA
jgi:hypothetical protein